MHISGLDEIFFQSIFKAFYACRHTGKDDRKIDQILLTKAKKEREKNSFLIRKFRSNSFPSMVVVVILFSVFVIAACMIEMFSFETNTVRLLLAVLFVLFFHKTFIVYGGYFCLFIHLFVV